MCSMHHVPSSVTDPLTLQHLFFFFFFFFLSFSYALYLAPSFWMLIDVLSDYYTLLKLPDCLAFNTDDKRASKYCFPSERTKPAAS